MNFSERLISARKAKGISQEVLAESLGVSRQAVSKWETGESKPDLDNLIALCNQLDLNIEYLCFGQSTPPKEDTKPTCPSSKRIILCCIIGIIVALLCFRLGFSLGSAQVHSEESDEVIIDQNYCEQLQDILVRDTSVNYDHVQSCHTFSLLLSSMPQNLEVSLIIQNSNYPDVPSNSIDCTTDGIYYNANLKNLLPNCIYRIVAVLSSGDEQRQIPLMDIHIDANGIDFGHSDLF